MVMLFVCRGVYVRVFDLINGCHSNANFAWKSMMFIRIEVLFIIIIIMVLQLWFIFPCQPFDFTFRRFLNFQEFFAIMHVEIWDN